MMTHDEMIAVIQAHKEGKQIQSAFKFEGEWNDCVKNVPEWDFYTMNYRVKPEPKYRPYANAEEFMKDFEKHGGWVKFTVADNVYCEYMYHVKTCENGNMLISGRSVGQLMNELDAKWCNDNSPFGVKVED